MTEQGYRGDFDEAALQATSGSNGDDPLVEVVAPGVVQPTRIKLSLEADIPRASAVAISDGEAPVPAATSGAHPAGPEWLRPNKEPKVTAGTLSYYPDRTKRLAGGTVALGLGYLVYRAIGPLGDAAAATLASAYGVAKTAGILNRGTRNVVGTVKDFRKITREFNQRRNRNR